VRQQTSIEYTHWLVTKGKWPNSAILRGYTPVLLVARADFNLVALRKLVVADAERRATIFLSANHTEIDRLSAMTSDYIADHFCNLWVSTVRLVGLPFQISEADEEATHWTLFGQGKTAPAWQGPADGVVPPETPVTVRPIAIEPSRFEVIGD
jgi:hypothetical protein